MQIVPKIDLKIWQELNRQPEKVQVDYPQQGDVKFSMYLLSFECLVIAAAQQPASQMTYYPALPCNCLFVISIQTHQMCFCACDNLD